MIKFLSNSIFKYSARRWTEQVIMKVIAILSAAIALLGLASAAPYAVPDDDGVRVNAESPDGTRVTRDGEAGAEPDGTRVTRRDRVDDVGPDGTRVTKRGGEDKANTM